MYFRSPYIDYMLYLFQATSNEILPRDLNIPNHGWEDYIRILYTRCEQEMPALHITNELPEIHVQDNPSKILLAFSGGKDSVAHAAYLKDKGFDVTLFHVKNANRSYPNERNVSSRISELIQAPLIIDTLKYSGKIERAESPVKNHLILALMIDYMQANQFTRCACGTYIEDSLETISSYFGLSDAYEFYLAFEKAIQVTFPSFRWLCWFRSDVHALAYLVNYHKELIPEYQSCLLPDRYRKRVKEANERKFNISLMPNRCGSCWKCAQEYLILHMFHYHTLTKEYITQSIFPQFQKDIAKVVADDPKNHEHEPLNQLIEHYITIEDVKRYLDPSNIEKDINQDVFK